MTVEYLDLEDLLRLTDRLGAGPVRDLGLLESSAARPRTTVFGRDAYSTRWDKAAALLHSVVRNHPLVDGNTRLGWLAADVLLRINGVVVEMADDEAFELVMAAAQGDLGIEEMAATLRSATPDGCRQGCRRPTSAGHRG